MSGCLACLRADQGAVTAVHESERRRQEQRSQRGEHGQDEVDVIGIIGSNRDRSATDVERHRRAAARTGQRHLVEQQTDAPTLGLPASRRCQEVVDRHAARDVPDDGALCRADRLNGEHAGSGAARQADRFADGWRPCLRGSRGSVSASLIAGDVEPRQRSCGVVHRVNVLDDDVGHAMCATDESASPVGVAHFDSGALLELGQVLVRHHDRVGQRPEQRASHHVGGERRELDVGHNAVGR